MTDCSFCSDDFCRSHLIWIYTGMQDKSWFTKTEIRGSIQLSISTSVTQLRSFSKLTFFHHQISIWISQFVIGCGNFELDLFSWDTGGGPEINVKHTQTCKFGNNQFPGSGDRQTGWYCANTNKKAYADTTKTWTKDNMSPFNSWGEMWLANTADLIRLQQQQPNLGLH